MGSDKNVGFGLITLFFFLFLFLSFQPSISLHGSTEKEEIEGGFVKVNVSEAGLDFAQKILIQRAIEELTPFHVPDISRSVRIPFIGNVEMGLSNIVLSSITVSSSRIQPGDTGILIYVTGATANISMDWSYSYSTWFVPVKISDSGNASSEVQGLEIGLTMGIQNHGGTLKLTLMDCGCMVKSIMIDINGGTSWFYQGLVDAFDARIKSAVELSLSKKIEEGVQKLDLLLSEIPKEVSVDNVTSTNITFVGDPLLANQSVAFAIDGLFTGSYISTSDHDKLAWSSYLVSCDDHSKMLAIYMDEAVFRSASESYHKAGMMTWVVDKVPEQSLLNTAGWRFIIPQLYRKYPNEQMNLNVSFSAPPVMKFTSSGIDTTMFADMTINVLDSNETVPVACISMVISASGSLGITGSNIVGGLQLNDFTLELKWSNVGNLHMYLIQTVVKLLMNSVFMPYANLKLRRGFPVPVIHGFTLTNAQVTYRNSGVIACTDITTVDSSLLGFELIMTVLAEKSRLIVQL